MFYRTTSPVILSLFHVFHFLHLGLFIASKFLQAKILDSNYFSLTSVF